MPPRPRPLTSTDDLRRLEEMSYQVNLKMGELAALQREIARLQQGQMAPNGDRAVPRATASADDFATAVQAFRDAPRQREYAVRPSEHVEEPAAQWRFDATPQDPNASQLRR